MDSIFQTLVAACKEIIQSQQEQKVEASETQDQLGRQEQKSEQCGKQDQKKDEEEEAGWLQFENAIADHIKIKNTTPNDPIILIEQSESDYSQQHQFQPSTPQPPPQDNICNEPEETQGQPEAKENQAKAPLRLICRAPEIKAPPLPKGKGGVQAKQAAQLNKKAEMTKQVLSKVNINELKAKLNLNCQPELTTPPKIAEEKPKPIIQTKQMPQNTPRQEQPQPIKANYSQPKETRGVRQGREVVDFTIPISGESMPESARGKVAKKGGKNERSFETKPQVSPAVNRVLERRRQEGGQIDLGVLTLDQVVWHCHERKLISEQFYLQYVANSSEDSILQFIDLFIKNNLKLWNFRVNKITIMDHRRLAEYLVRLHGKDFKICAPDSLNPSIKEFLQNLYGLTQIKYKKLLQSLDAESKVAEWNTMRIRYQKFLNGPVKIQPAPSFTPTTTNAPSTTTTTTTIKAPVKKPIAMGPPTIKMAPVVKSSNEKKRPLNALYEQGRYRQMEDEDEMRLNSLKNQLKRKKV